MVAIQPLFFSNLVSLKGVAIFTKDFSGHLARKISKTNVNHLIPSDAPIPSSSPRFDLTRGRTQVPSVSLCACGTLQDFQRSWVFFFFCRNYRGLKGITKVFSFFVCYR